MEANIESAMSLEYRGIRFTPDFVAELEGAHLILKLKKENIRQIDLRYGQQAHHPVIQFLFGIVLTVLGLAPFRFLNDWLAIHTFTFHFGMLMVVFLFWGLWTIYESLHRGYYLAVELTVGRKKLAFGRRVDRCALGEFLASAQAQFGYPIFAPSHLTN